MPRQTSERPTKRVGSRGGLFLALVSVSKSLRLSLHHQRPLSVSSRRDGDDIVRELQVEEGVRRRDRADLHRRGALEHVHDPDVAQRLAS